jgi:hypothetical protein
MKKLALFLVSICFVQVCAAQSIVGTWIPVNCYAIIEGVTHDMTANAIKYEPEVEYTSDGKVISALSQGEGGEYFETTYVHSGAELLLTNVHTGEVISMQISDFSGTSLTLSNEMESTKLVRTFRRK